MKIIAILTVIAMLIMGVIEQDATAAIVLVLLFMPVLLDGKKVKKCRKIRRRKTAIGSQIRREIGLDYDRANL